MKCKCGGEIMKSKQFSKDSLLNCMKCNQCEEILFTPEQMKEMKVKTIF